MLTFAAPAFLWTLLAVPLVVLLHRLRVRRQQRDVAGLFLWRRAKDVGSRRPRFHAGLLLLLQVLAVTALALALARPQIVTAGPVDRVIVIDASASMLATDGAAAAAEADSDPDDAGTAGARTRFEVALETAASLAEGAGRVAIVRAGREATTVLPFTNDLLRVREALGALRAGDDGLDAPRASLLARDLAGAGAAGADGGSAGAADGVAPAEIHWLSDEPPPSAAGVRVHPLAGPGENVGITGFELTAGQAWIRLSSNAPGPVEVPVELLRDDAPVARTSRLVPARGDVSFTMPAGDGATALTVRIDAPPGDALALDDVAHAGLPALEVGLEEPFGALERALGAIPGVATRVSTATRRLPLDLRVLTLDEGAWSVPGVAGTAAAPVAAGGDGAGDEAGGAPGAPADVRVPAVDPAAGEEPAGTLVLLPARDAPASAAEVLDWDRTEPLLRFVDLRDLVVALATPAPFGEEPGWTTLVRGVPSPAEDGPEEGAPVEPVPLLQRAERPEGTVYRFAFHPVRGDLTLRPAFPTLVVNLVDLVRGTPRVALGAPLPEGATRDGAPAEVALEPGLYALGGRTVHASLLSEGETRLPGPDAFADVAVATEGGAATAPAAGEPDEARARAARDLLPVLAGLVVLLLLVEWWGFTGGRIGGRRLPGTGGRHGPHPPRRRT